MIFARPLNRLGQWCKWAECSRIVLCLSRNVNRWSWPRIHSAPVAMDDLAIVPAIQGSRHMLQASVFLSYAKAIVFKVDAKIAHWILLIPTISPTKQSLTLTQFLISAYLLFVFPFAPFIFHALNNICSYVFHECHKFWTQVVGLLTQLV